MVVVPVAKHANRALSPFFKRLDSDFAKFHRRGTSLLRVTSDCFLAGFDFYPTGGAKNLRYLAYFAMPLFLPCNGIYLSFGDRIPRNPNPGLACFPVQVTGDDDIAIQTTISVMHEVGLPILNQMGTLEGFRRYLVEESKPYQIDPRYWLALAATLIHLRETEAAKSALRSLRQYVAEYVAKGRMLYEADHVLNENASQLEAALLHEGCEGAAALLTTWREQSIMNLRIGDMVPSSI